MNSRETRKASGGHGRPEGPELQGRGGNSPALAIAISLPCTNKALLEIILRNEKKSR